MKKINTIIFDLGYVLLNIDYQKTITEFKKIGIRNASKLYSKKAQDNLFNKLETGNISEDFFLTSLQIKTSNATKKQVKYAWNSMLLDLPKKRISLLKLLKSKYHIFLLSNTNSIHISEIRNKLGEEKYQKFYNLFNKVYYSHEIRLRKPDIKIFQLVLEENKLNASEVLFIDDSLQHIQGAKTLGIKTIHLKNKKDVITLFPDIIQ